MVVLRRVALIAAVAAVTACASGGGANAEREREIGYKAARRGYWQEARLRFERAVTIDPADAEALNNLAVSLEVTGRYDAARETYRRALAADPGNRRIEQNRKRFEDFYQTFIATDEAQDPGSEATP